MTNKEHYADYKWIKVKRYDSEAGKTLADKYNLLNEHHLKETTFLINEVRALADKLDVFEAEAARVAKEYEEAAAKAKKKKDREDIMRSFFVCWFGFSALIAMLIDFFVDKQTQYANNALILTTMLGIGGLAAFLFCRAKWKREHKGDQHA